jgi:hypothetical protein
MSDVDILTRIDILPEITNAERMQSGKNQPT